MNTIKKYLGILWILLGIAAGYYLIVSQAIPKFESPKPEDKIPALIYALILTPIIAIGLCIFGYYALIGEYDTYEDEAHHKHIREE